MKKCFFKDLHASAFHDVTALDDVTAFGGKI